MSNPETLQNAARPGKVVVALICAVLFSAVPTGSGQDASRLEDLGRLAATTAVRIGAGSTHLENEKAIAVLCGLGAAANDAIADLGRSEESRRRLAAVRILSGRRPAGGDGPANDLIPFLDDRSHMVRTAALDGIRARFGLDLDTLVSPDARPVAAIEPLLGDPFWPVRRAAVLALSAVGHPSAGRGLLHALHDVEPEVRRTALYHVDRITADLSTEELTEATRGLGEAELIQFLKGASAFARLGNAAFFRDLSRSDTASIALLALKAAVAAEDPRSCSDAAGPRMSWIIDQSIAQAGAGEDAADTLVGWLAEHHEERLVAAMEEALVANRLPAEELTILLWDALSGRAIPILERWAHDNLDNEVIVESCLTHLDTGTTPAGAAALARLLPRFEGAVRERAVKKAVNYLEIADHPSLREVLVHVALHDPPRTALAAFGALCRWRDLPAGLLARLLDRFGAEEQKTVRESLVRRLADAGTDRNRRAVARVLTDEIVGARPAALVAAACIDRVLGSRAEPPGSAELEALRSAAADAIIALCDRTDDMSQREVLLLALIRINEPRHDAYVARHVEELWESEGLGGVGRLVSALGGFDGAVSIELLRRMARDDDPNLSKRGVSALLGRRDPLAIPIADEVFARLTISSRTDLVEKIGACAPDSGAIDFLEKIVDAEQDSDILAIAIESLDPGTIRSNRERLLAIAEDASVGAGRAASGAAIMALGRIGDREAIDLFTRWSWEFRDEARTSTPAFFDMFYERPYRVLTALRALALSGSREAPDLLAALLLQHQRALADRTILENWEAHAGGSEERPDHSWPANVFQALLAFEDPVVEAALLAEFDTLERTGELFLLGDAVFSVLHYQLVNRRRCPALRAKFRELVDRCRPDHSPAEFRISIDLAERAAAAGRSAEAAGHYLRAHYILRYHAPAKEVVRQLLADSNSFTGYAPAPSLISEVHALMADVMTEQGDENGAARMAAAAGRHSPFARQLDELPKQVGGLPKEDDSDE